MEKTPTNLDTLRQERRSLVWQKKEVEKKGLPPALLEKINSELDKFGETSNDRSIARLGGMEEAKERLTADKLENEMALGMDESALTEELGPKYADLKKLQRELDELNDYQFQLIRRSQSAPNERLDVLEAIQSEIDARVQNKKDPAKTDPKISRAFDLIGYRKGLSREGHIAPTPSVLEAERQIALRMASGRPVFLYGPTGTGKTSIARFVAKRLTGKNPEMVYCNPQTREATIWGKTGIRPVAGSSAQIETVDIYGPLAKAIREGRVCIFDEFTALPREQMVTIKGIMNAKPGDTVNIPGNGEVRIAAGFQLIFTANLKSDKNPERQELPPEIAREFEQNNLEVKYQPETETYDIMLARLMARDGSVTLSDYDLETTLPNLVQAIAEIQTAYYDALPDKSATLTGSKGDDGAAPSLKKLVMTQGTVEAVITDWLIEKKRRGPRMADGSRQSFAQYLDQRLKIGLTYKEYPAADRALAAKIFALRGLLRTLTPRELDLPPNVFSFKAAQDIRKESDDLKLSFEETRHSLRDLAQLDPLKRKARDAKNKAKGFASAEPPAATVELGPERFAPVLLETFKSWYADDAKNNPGKLEAAARHSVELVAPSSLDWESRRADSDAAKFGEHTLNPETVGIDWETIPPEKIKIVQLPDTLNGKKVSEIGAHIVSTYGSTHHIPGIEYWEYVLNNPAKAPASLKDGKWQFFFGSILRVRGGVWNVPSARWVGSGWARDALWLAYGWGAYYRVVLVEK